MRRVFAVLLLLASTATANAAPNWTGEWDTKWRDGGARMILEQHDDQVAGTYPAYGGKILGTLQGRELHGHWTEGPRSGDITFVLAPDGQSFMGRFETGEWWTGGRAAPAGRTIPIDQAGARQALRTFIAAGNAARSGEPDVWATAASVLQIDDAGAAMPPGQKLAAAKSLFELVDQTTFQLFAIPGRRAQGDHVDLDLKQAGTGVSLPLRLVRGDDHLWRVAMPQKGDLAHLRDALLARSGGRIPPPGDVARRATARDAMRSFIDGFADWNGSGRQQVLSTLDLSAFSDATRDYEGELAAAYMNKSLDRIGQVVPQEISDDPQNRTPYTVFAHPAGSIILAPMAEPGGGVTWRFTADSVRGARDLYTTIEDMPEVAGGFAPDVPSTYMQLRRWVRHVAPGLFVRVGPIEAWQAVGIVILLAACFAAAYVLSWLVLAVLRVAVGGREMRSEHEFRWPLRLALALGLYALVVPALGLPEAVKRVSTGATGVILSLALVWGGWKLLDTFGVSAMRRAEARQGTLDEILVSLVLGALKLALLAGGLIFVAQALSIPYEGVLAGLGIGGLAVAFASRETLSNVFGAGILVADRPFRRGDWIESGDAKGTVEHVGIRSTRIRTGEDSLMFVPNGKLADAAVNNLGTRRHRVSKAKLLVLHAARADQIDAFMDALRRTISEQPDVQHGSTQVGIASITPEGVEIDIICALEVRSAAIERADRSALMIGILRLAERMRVPIGGNAPAPVEALPA